MHKSSPGNFFYEINKFKTTTPDYIELLAAILDYEIIDSVDIMNQYMCDLLNQRAAKIKSFKSVSVLIPDIDNIIVSYITH